MSQISPHQDPLNFAQILAIYLEPIVRERRIAIVGALEPRLIQVLSKSGARLIHIYDPTLSADHREVISIEGVRVHVASLRNNELGVRDGAFDVALVPDFSVLSLEPYYFGHVRKLVGSQGVAVLACSNREQPQPRWVTSNAPIETSPSYTEFYDLCSLQFAEVTMIGVAPFLGYSVTELAPTREFSVAFDSSLVSSTEAPEWFIAVASQRHISTLETYEIIQIPSASIRTISALSQESSTSKKTEELQRLIDAEHTKVKQLSSQLENQHNAFAEQQYTLHKLTDELQKERQQRAHFESYASQNNQLQDQIETLEAKLLQAHRLLEGAQRQQQHSLLLQQEYEEFKAQFVANQLRVLELEQVLNKVDQERHLLSVNNQQLEHDFEQQKKTMHVLQAQCSKAQNELVEATQKSTQQIHQYQQQCEQLQQKAQEAQAQMSSSQLELSSIQTSYEEELKKLESTLRMRGEELRNLRSELERRERMIRELVAQVERSSSVRVPQPQEHSNRTVSIIDTESDYERAQEELKTLVNELKLRDLKVEEEHKKHAKSLADIETERAKQKQFIDELERHKYALQIANERIAELQNSLPSKQENTTHTEHDDQALTLELNSLRQALAQMHEQNRRLASNEKTLAQEQEQQRLQTKIQEQQNLIAQLNEQLAKAQFFTAD